VNVFSLALALPSQHTWTADFGLSVAMMSLAIQKHPFKGYEGRGLEIMNKRSSLLPQLRQTLISDAIAHGHSHILFIDSDQAFPPQLAHMLARHHKQFVGCNIATKNQEKSIPTARYKPGPGEWWGGHQVFSHGKRGIEQVWRLGFGVVLIDLSIFKTIPKPWFEIRWVPEVDDFEGEDWFFCRLLDAHNIPIYVEHEASLLVDHIGTWRFGHDGIQRDANDAELRVMMGGKQ
jgi:hypothetical protein